MLLGHSAGPLAGEAGVLVYFNGQNGGAYGIGEAEIVGGVVTENPNNPLVVAAGSGWVADHVKDPWVLPGGLVLFVAGNGDGTSDDYQIGRLTRATVNDAWAYDSTSTPLLAFGSAGQPDEAGALFPTVLPTPEDASFPLKMWYAGLDVDGVTHRVCYAKSSSAVGAPGTWTKVGAVLDVGAGGAFDDIGVLPLGIVRTGGVYHLFYGGRQDVSLPRWQTGLATFTDPEGVYTKSPSNPILSNLVAVSSISKTLTADASAGSTTAQVASTAEWADYVGEPFVLADNNSETETRELVSIDSGTVVTLSGTAQSAFTTASGATLRPMRFNSIVPRTVRVLRNGTWELWATPFQPVADLTVGGQPLREGAMRFTADAPEGPWTSDRDLGLLFPLFPISTGWHKFSAENPNVISLPA
jgi:hypothetical protein